MKGLTKKYFKEKELEAKAREKASATLPEIVFETLQDDTLFREKVENFFLDNFDAMKNYFSFPSYPSNFSKKNNL